MGGRESAGSRTVWRIIAVTVLALATLSLTLPDSRRLWYPTGTLGYTTDRDNVVTGVQPGSSADAAGLKVGDRIDVAKTPRQFAWQVTYDPTTLSAGDVVTIAVDRDGRTRFVTPTSAPSISADLPSRALIALRLLSDLVFVGLGAALVLLRPSSITWGFYLYCVGFAPGPSSVILSLLPFPANVFADFFNSSLGALGYAGLLLFALGFLHDEISSWRAVFTRLVLYLALLLVALTALSVLGPEWLGWMGQKAARAQFALQAAVAAVVMYALLDTYVHSRGDGRQRIRWVVFAFGISLIAASVDYFFYPRLGEPYWLHATFRLSGVVVPIAVAYAIVRHRVIDVNFVISRAVVFAALTTLLVAIFGVIDWFFTNRLQAHGLGTITEIAVAVALGFWLNTLHRRVDTLVDRVLFRRKHKAEVRLQRIAAGLMHSSSSDAIGQALVDEPVMALGLASSALFWRAEDRSFESWRVHGWDSDAARMMDKNDMLILQLAARDEPLILDEVDLLRDGLPGGPARPCLAIPVSVRGELRAICLYGSHEHGEALDPDEVQTLFALATAAAAAFDHVEAADLRRRLEAVESVERENAGLRAKLAALRAAKT